MSSSSTQRPSGGESPLWWAVTSASAVVGTTVAWVGLGTRQLVTCWVLATLLVMCGVVAVRGQRVRSSSWIRHSAVGGVLSTAAVGLIMGLGLAGVVWILALTVTARAVRARVLARLVGDRGRPGADQPSTPRPAPVEGPATSIVLPPAATELSALRDLDDEALCLAWRRSFVHLQRAMSPSSRLCHVQHRQRILDELERRSPDGLAAWLASGCRAAGNPLPYLVRCRSRDRQRLTRTDGEGGLDAGGDEKDP
jgi:hypothetical protein